MPDYKRDDLGTRMKENYESRAKVRLVRRMPVAIRIDGKAFHTFTKNFEKPFDKILMNSMQETMKYLCENIQGCVFGYSQSDEITLILIDYQTLTTDAWFNYEVQKLCSVSASMATMAFNKFFEKNVKNFIQDCAMDHEMHGSCGKGTVEYDLCEAYQKAIHQGAMFDSRCFNIPREEVTNLVYWRQLDAIRNSIQMVGQANFSHNQLQNRTCNDIKEMLISHKNIDWNSFPNDCKVGAACVKINKDSSNCGWQIDRNMPILKGEDREYLDKLINIHK